MEQKSNVILVGFMGTGKSRVGRLVAQRLGKMFVDMDAVIQERAGKSISRIFAEEGEPHFRSLERAMVEELARQSDRVVAAGGGIVLDERNIRDFGRNGVVICLKASPQAILERVAGEQHRPLIEGADKARAILEILEARQPLYDAIPHSVDTTARSPEACADAVVDIFRRAASKR